MLSEKYKYVSVLGTDTKGKSFRVSKTGIEVNDSFMVERGFVVRIHNGINYSEYSFNEISEDNLDAIVKNIEAKLNKVSKDISINSYEIIEEEEIKIEGSYSGMEDPKSWGIQCIATFEREIKDGKLTETQLLKVVKGFTLNL